MAFVFFFVDMFIDTIGSSAFSVRCACEWLGEIDRTTKFNFYNATNFFFMDCVDRRGDITKSSI